MAKKINKVVAGAVIAGLMGSSCEDQYNLEDNIYCSFAENRNEGVQFMNIEVSNLSEDFIVHLQKIGDILSDVMTNKESAEEFCNNPDDYLANRKISLKMEISEQEKMVIKALTDDEVKKVLQENDLKKFINICKDKGYITFQQNRKIEDFSVYFKNNEEFNKFKEYIQESGNEEIVNFAAIPAVAVAIGSVGAALYAVLEVSAGVQVNVVYHMDFWWDSGEGSSYGRSLSRVTSKEPMIRLWVNHSKSDIDYDIVRSEIIEERAEEIASIFQENCPVSEIDIEKVKDIVKTNLEGYYGLRRE